MSLTELRELVNEKLSGLEELTTPIGELDQAHWSRELDHSDSAESPLSDLGSVRLGGTITIAAHLSRRDDPPLDLDQIEGDNQESDLAWASFVFSANGDASLSTSRMPMSGVSVNAGVEADGKIQLAHHRSLRQTETSLSALTGLARDLRLPYGLDHELPEGDILEVILDGGVALRASVGWAAGLVQEITGEVLDQLELSQPVAVSAGVTAALTVSAGIRGELRVIVQRDEASTPDRPKVRVQLNKGKDRFVGAGLKIEAGVDFVNLEEFVDAIFERALDLPNSLVDELREVQGDLEMLQERFDALRMDVRGELSEVIGKAESALQLDDLIALKDASTTLPQELQSVLQPLIEVVQISTEKIKSISEDFGARLAEGFGEAGRPLAQARQTIGRWIAAYDDLRDKAKNLVLDRAKEGIKAEFSAGINRTRSSEALLELQFDLVLARGAYESAIRGDFEPALLLAQANGANGVEVLSGTLKQTQRTGRFVGLKINFFGFKMKRDFQSWNESRVVTDVLDGSITLNSDVGASLTGGFGAQIRELRFLFEVAGAAERRGDEVFLRDPKTAYRATLFQSTELRRARAIRLAVPLHVAGARFLLGLSEGEAAHLERKIFAETGPYVLDLELEFPAATVQRIFHFEAVNEKEPVLRFWRAFVRAVELLEMPIQSGNSFVPMSRFLTDKAFADVRRNPNVNFVAKKFRVEPIPGFRIQAGAVRKIGAHVLEAVSFIESLAAVRRKLILGESARRCSKELRAMAAQTASTVGAFSTQPLAAKYLSLALLAGSDSVAVSYRFKRGNVEVTV